MSEQGFLFVKTRFTPPDIQSSSVRRESILDTMANARQKKLTLVCAPAGYGKSSVLAQHFQSLDTAGLDVTWLSLDKYDADLGKFLRNTIHAIRQRQPEFAESLLSLLQAGFTDSTELISLNFIDAIATLPRPMTLFIDDYYLAETREISAVLKEILLGSDQLRCVVATRNTPRWLPLSRLRMLDEVCEIEQEALRFSHSESQHFFADTLNLAINTQQIDLLSDKAEGWAAGMQLASISLRNCDNPEHFIREFTGENRSISEFLGDEILSRLSEEQHQFLLRCSLLPRFNFQLCNQVFNISNAADILEQLREHHLFIIALDDVDYWFRFHHLFSQYLRKKMHQCHGDQVAGIHTRASHWHEQRREFTDAIEHALESGNHNHAAAILDKISAELFYQGKISVLESYAEALSDEATRNHPSQQMDRIWQWIVTWRFDKARIALSQVRHVLDEYQQRTDLPTEELEFLESKYAHREMSYAFFSDATQDAQKLAEHWLLHHINEDLSMVSSAKTMLMVSERDQFVLHDVTAKVDALHELHVEANFPYGVVKGDCLCGATLLMQGQLDKARDFFERAEVTASQLHGRFAPLTAMPCLHLAAIAYERNDLARAEELVRKYLPLSQGFGFAENIICGYLTRARLEFSQCPNSPTESILEQGRKAALSTGFERLRCAMATEHIRQLLILGDKSAAFSLARALGISGGASQYQPGENSDRIHLLQTLAWVRISVAMGNPSNAIRVLSHWHNHLKEHHCYFEAVRCAVVLADIHYTHEDPLSGRQYLSFALDEAVAHGYCRVFADEGPALAPYLQQYAPGAQEAGVRETIERILPTYGKPAKTTAADAHANMDIADVNLTEREKEILNLCRSDKSNAEIAHALSITEGTVKWYWQSIFSKLGVRRRRQAAMIAADLGLL
jgi:LuxR family maltose regulon positive regulatory protein